MGRDCKTARHPTISVNLSRQSIGILYSKQGCRQLRRLAPPRRVLANSPDSGTLEAEERSTGHTVFWCDAILTEPGIFYLPHSAACGRHTMARKTILRLIDSLFENSLHV